MRPARSAPRPPVDWDVVRAHLDRAAGAMRDALRPPPERASAIMEERARSLARPVDPTPPAEGLCQILTFNLGVEAYGIELRHVSEVMRPMVVTPLPAGASGVAGVANLRGEVLPVLDLRSVLGVAPSPPPPEDQVVVVLGPARPNVGILADGVGGIVAVQRAQILPSARGRDRFLLGVTTSAVALVDGEALLSDEPPPAGPPG